MLGMNHGGHCHHGTAVATYVPNRHACFFQEMRMLGLDHAEHVKDSPPDRLVNPHNYVTFQM